jgi:predicted alpha/beta-fold hydrolase
MYHSGVSDDLLRVGEHAAGTGYERVGLVGFSLGGNVTLKLAGDLGAGAPGWMAGAVGISVPVDLAGSAATMAGFVNRIYMGRFLRCLRAKLRAKQSRYPNEMNDDGYGRIRSFRDFDGRYTAPIHGFASAEDYWQKCGAVAVLRSVAVPTLLLNSRDDPFLSSGCFPDAAARGNPFLHLEVAETGGHVGFLSPNSPDGETFSEARAVEFLGAGTED